MAIDTNGVATKREYNTYKYVYSFTSGDLDEYPTKEMLTSAGLTVSGNYTTDQCPRYSDVSIPSKNIIFVLSNSLASKADLETITVYVNGNSAWTKSFDGVSKNGEISWTIPLPSPSVSTSLTFSVSIGEAGAARHWWYADNYLSNNWISISDGAKTINYTITNDYAKYFKYVTKIRFHIGNDSDGDELPQLSWQ